MAKKKKRIMKRKDTQDEQGLNMAEEMLVWSHGQPGPPLPEGVVTKNGDCYPNAFWFFMNS